MAGQAIPGRNDYRHYSARATTERRGRTLHVTFSGPIGGAAIEVLERRVLPDRRASVVSLDRLDRALTIWDGPAQVNVQNWPQWVPPAAVIVREDQYERHAEFCRLLAQRGLIRVPFLPSQLEWAQAFVERVAARSG
jgi:hypothetical protein